MRAKEYITGNAASLRYPDQIKQIVADMLPLRADKQKTDAYFNRKLSADIRRQGYLLAKELYEKRNAMQLEEPEPFEIQEGEIPVEIASAVRDELFEVIKEDPSFGYLYFLLGNLQNAKRQTNPIYCIPDEKAIADALKTFRDDYPKNDLSEFLDDDLNFSQYRKLTETGLTDEATILAWFNNAYRIYDEIRLLKAKPIAAIRFFEEDNSHESDTLKVQTYQFICTLIESTASDDRRLGRIREELLRLLPKSNTTEEDAAVADEKTKGNNKIRTAVIIELLNRLGKGKSFNDLSKICRLVAYLTGGSEKKLYNDALSGIQFTEYHKKEISEVNKILSTSVWVSS